MEIRRAVPAERDVLLDIWFRSVRATHHFVPEAGVQSMTPQVKDDLANSESEFWVVCDDADAPVGFMGVS